MFVPRPFRVLSFARRCGFEHVFRKLPQRWCLGRSRCEEAREGAVGIVPDEPECEFPAGDGKSLDDWAELARDDWRDASVVHRCRLINEDDHAEWRQGELRRDRTGCRPRDRVIGTPSEENGENCKSE